MTDYHKLAKVAGSIGYAFAGLAISTVVLGEWLQASIAWCVSTIAFAVAYHASAKWIQTELARLQNIIRPRPGLAVEPGGRHAVSPPRTPKNSPT